MAPRQDANGPGRYHDTALWRALDALAETVDRRIGWDRLPRPLGLAVLAGVRDTLRRRNLHDTRTVAATNEPPVSPRRPEDMVSRTLDGSYNDLTDPAMGMAGSRFGRNIPLDDIPQESRSDKLTPSPREVSRALMTRSSLIEATSVNALVAPWLQFMIRDWFSHGTSPQDHPWEIELAEDDEWPQRPMHVMRVMEDPTRPASAPGRYPTSINTSSHWWDASQIYGHTRGVPEVRAHRPRREAARRAGRLAAPAARAGRQPDRGARLLDRAGHAADGVHPRAQRRLRHAPVALSRAGATSRSSSGPGWSSRR